MRQSCKNLMNFFNSQKSLVDLAHLEKNVIKLHDEATPHALYTPRNVPIPMREKVKKELDRMESMGIISKVLEPTPWCAGMVVVPKKTGNIRICVDLKPLNRSVLRETHPIPKVDDILAQLTGATCFSKLDANSGFWQIPLAEQSCLLTTFIAPFGRYFFSQITLWNFKFTRDVSNEDEPYFGWFTRGAVSHWWYPNFWKKSSRTWCQTFRYSKPTTNIWCNLELRKMWI